MATSKKKITVRTTTRRGRGSRTGTIASGFLSKTNRHIVAPLTASQIMKAVGLRPKDVAEVRRLIAQYAPLESKSARRR